LLKPGEGGKKQSRQLPTCSAKDESNGKRKKRKKARIPDNDTKKANRRGKEGGKKKIPIEERHVLAILYMRMMREGKKKGEGAKKGSHLFLSRPRGGGRKGEKPSEYDTSFAGKGEKRKGKVWSLAARCEGRKKRRGSLQ